MQLFISVSSPAPPLPPRGQSGGLRAIHLPSFFAGVTDQEGSLSLQCRTGLAEPNMLSSSPWQSIHLSPVLLSSFSHEGLTVMLQARSRWSSGARRQQHLRLEVCSRSPLTYQVPLAIAHRRLPPAIIWTMSPGIRGASPSPTRPGAEPSLNLHQIHQSI